MLTPGTEVIIQDAPYFNGHLNNTIGYVHNPGDTISSIICYDNGTEYILPLFNFEFVKFEDC